MTSIISEKVLKSQRLPSPPAIALRVLDLAGRQDASINDIADAIAIDPSLAARILKYANSVVVGSRQEVASVQRAVVLLGLRAVKVAALGFSLVKNKNLTRCPHFNYDLHWAHATAMAVTTRGIVTATHRHLAEEAFVAGLLARVGKLAFVTAIPAEYEPVIAAIGSVMRDGSAEERAAFGGDHVEVGARLLAIWKLPNLLIEAVRHQASPQQAPDAEARILAAAIQRARPMADALCGLTPRTDDEVRAGLGDLNYDELQKQFRSLAVAFELSLDDLPEPGQIEEQARDLADEISVATQTEAMVIQSMNTELVRQSMIDVLTGINNRRAFDQRLGQELERSRRYGRPLSLLMIDIDKFKTINDSHGHVIGDMVLRSVAKRIADTIRSCDFAARYGGEEFAIIATESNSTAAAQFAERVRRVVFDEPIIAQDRQLSVSISIGGVSADGSKVEIDPTAFIAAADAQLYQAKGSGRNCSRLAAYEPARCVQGRKSTQPSPAATT